MKTLYIRNASAADANKEIDRVRRHYRKHAKGAIYPRLKADIERTIGADNMFLLEDKHGALAGAGFVFSHPRPADKPNPLIVDLPGENEIPAVRYVELGGDLITPRWQGKGLQKTLIAVRMVKALILAPTQGTCHAIVDSKNGASIGSLSGCAFTRTTLPRDFLSVCDFAGVRSHDFKKKYYLMQADVAADNASAQAKLIAKYREELSEARARERGVTIDISRLGAAYRFLLTGSLA